MKRLNRALALLAALAALVCLASCTPPSPERQIAIAREKLNQAGSFRYNMNMDIQMSVGGSPVGLTAACAAECITDPLTLRLELDFSRGDPITVYAEQTGSGYVSWTRGSAGWTRQELDGLGELEQYDVRSALDACLSSCSEVTKAGIEELGGVKAERYDCVVSAGAMDKIMDSSGAWTEFSALGISGEQAREMLSGLGEMPLSVWIDVKTSLPLRYDADMSGIMGTLVSRLSESGSGLVPDVSLSRLSISVTMSDFDAVDAIEIPAEALAASGS